ncbi:cilia- and flagella-associated protein 100 isoform X2 [Monodelphis domestica]|uniref:cilia- and flagella-associated protein 100 isoform X2 n=1 Tax=Monodelphis domestica TaxID=13616 RepID=UPI0024E21B25|nr:cilia- and flagella-associated protein 100 isoform X2 [Monodelphis domestica]
MAAVPSTSQKIVPSASQKIVPSASQKIVPSASQKIVPSASQKIVPSASQKIIPSASQKILPSTSQKILPSPSQKILPSPSQKIATLDDLRLTLCSGPVTGAIEVSKETTVNEGNQDEGGNPFHMSPDLDFFLLRDKEKEKQRVEREAKKRMRVYEKMTYSSKIAAKRTNLRRQLQMEDHMDEQALHAENQRLRDLHESTFWKIAVTKDKQAERDNLATYIEQKRQMFLIQYALDMKKEEILRLEMLATKEEMKLEKAEKFLEKDATLFDEFLKENDRNSVQAMRIAEKEAKAKMEKIIEIRDITAQILMIKSEISKFEDNVHIFKIYKDFLYKLSPREWLMTHARKHLTHAATKMSLAAHKDSIPFLPMEKETQFLRSSQSTDLIIPLRLSPPASIPDLIISKEGKASPTSSSSQELQPLFRLSPQKKQSSTTMFSAKTDETDSDDELDLYFTEPQQLLDIFSHLEEQNLSLIQNSQETEEALDEINHSLRNTQNKMDRDINQLKLLSSTLMSSIAKEEEIAADLQLKSRVFSFGEYKGDYQSKMLASLNKKVVEVYRKCIGDCESSLGTLQMLTIIEHQLDELLENLERVPAWKIEQVEKAKEKERRIRLREEKMKLLKEMQEERLKKALARAQATIKKKTGRKLMYRSEPVVSKVKGDEGETFYDREKEELLFFFT